MKLSTYVIGIPVVVVAVAIAVANRQTVDFSLDPFSQGVPAIGARLPLFLLLFAAFGAGLLVGWIAAVWTRAPLRPRASKTKPPPR